MPPGQGFNQASPLDRYAARWSPRLAAVVEVDPPGRSQLVRIGIQAEEFDGRRLLALQEGHDQRRVVEQRQVVVDDAPPVRTASMRPRTGRRPKES